MKKAKNRNTRIFMELIRIDLKRWFCRRNIIWFVCFLVIALYLVQLGVNDYRAIEADKENFTEMEVQRFSRYKSYSEYIGSGVRMFFMPSPNCIFFGTPPVFKRVRAVADDKTTLNVYTSLLNGTAFETMGSDFMNYSGFLLYGGSLLFLLIGYDVGRDREYTRFLAAVSGGMNVVSNATLLSRYVLAFVFTFVVSGSALVLAVVNGMFFAPGVIEDIFVGFSLLLTFYNFLFLLLGIAAGSIRSKFRGLGMLAAFWLIFLFVIPGVMAKYISGKAQKAMPAYRLEMKELEYRASAGGKDEMKQFKLKVIEDFRGIVDEYHRLFALFPTSCFFSLSHEASSRGFENLFEFYIVLGEHKAAVEDFKRGIMKSAGINDPGTFGDKEVLDYIKRGGNILHVDSIFPEMDLVNISLSLYFMAAVAFGHFFFRRSVYTFSSRFVPGARHLEIAVGCGEMQMYKAPASFIDRFFNHVTRKSRADFGKLALEGENIGKKDTKKFVYLGGPDCLPGHMRVCSFIPFFQKIGRLSKKEKEAMNTLLKPFRLKRFKELSEDEKAEVTLTLVRFSGLNLYMLVDFVNRMTLEGIRRVNKQLEGLPREGVTVLYFNTYPTYDPPLTFGGCTLVNEAEGRYELMHLK